MDEREFINKSEDKESISKSELIYAEKMYCRKKQSLSDVIAFQSVLCIIIAVIFTAVNLVYPDICSMIYDKFISCIYSEKEIFSNPLNYIC